MKLTEKNIKYENANESAWVCDDGKLYIVFRNLLTHSVSDSAYPRNEDGLSIAKARCDYFAKRKVKL